jgi:hypothetical protein
MGVFAVLDHPRLEGLALVLPGVAETVGDDPVECLVILGLGGLEELPLEGFEGGLGEFLAPAGQSVQLLRPPYEPRDGLTVSLFDHRHLFEGLHEVVRHLVHR